MKFLDQLTQTNWKFIGIIIVLGMLTAVGILWYIKSTTSQTVEMNREEPLLWDKKKDNSSAGLLSQWKTLIRGRIISVRDVQSPPASDIEGFVFMIPSDKFVSVLGKTQGYLDYSEDGLWSVQTNVPLGVAAARGLDNIKTDFLEPMAEFLMIVPSGSYILCFSDTEDIYKSIHVIGCARVNASVGQKLNLTIESAVEGIKLSGQKTEPFIVLKPSDLDVSTWQTYESSDYGFQIRYPQDWYAVESKVDVTLYARIEEYYTVDVMTIYQSDGGQLPTIESLQNFPPWDPIIIESQRDLELPSGFRARIYRTSEGAAHVYITNRKDTVLFFSIQLEDKDYYPIFDQMLLTFQPTFQLIESPDK